MAEYTSAKKAREDYYNRLLPKTESEKIQYFKKDEEPKKEEKKERKSAQLVRRRKPGEKYKLEAPNLVLNDGKFNKGGEVKS